ncbi:hypothetical protein D3C72_1701480 [compost metagenome]
MQHAEGLFGLAHDETLGDFQLQALGVQAEALDQLLQALHQQRLAQLGAGQVDRERAEGRVPFLPLLHLPAGVLQHPVAEGQDEAGFFRQGDEPLRGNFAELRVVPTHQGLGAHQGLVLQAELGLVAQ